MLCAFMSYDVPNGNGRGTFLSAPITDRTEIGDLFVNVIQQIARNLGVEVDQIHVLSFSILPTVINETPRRQM